MMFFKICVSATLVSAAVNLTDAPPAIIGIAGSNPTDDEIRLLQRQVLSESRLTVGPERFAEKIENLTLNDVDDLDTIGRFLLLLGHVNSIHPVWIQGFTSMKEKTNVNTYDAITSLKHACLHLTLTKDCTLLDKGFFTKLKFPPPTEEMLISIYRMIPYLLQNLIQTNVESDRIIFKNLANQLVVHDIKYDFLREYCETLTSTSIKDVVDAVVSSNVVGAGNSFRSLDFRYPQLDLLEVLVESYNNPPNPDVATLLQEITNRKAAMILNINRALATTTEDAIGAFSEVELVTFVTENVIPYLFSKNIDKLDLNTYEDIPNGIMLKIMHCNEKFLNMAARSPELEKSFLAKLNIAKNNDPPLIFESWGSFLGTGLTEDNNKAAESVQGLPEKRITDYALGNELGRGSYGRVCEASKDGLVYAVKIVSGENKRGLFTVSNEIKILRRNDPNKNLIKIHDAFRIQRNSLADPNEVAIVMDLLKGKSLFDHVNENGGRLGEDEISRIAYHMLLALDHLHSRGIVHLDIKPDNIFHDITQNRYVLIDYGFSATVGENIIERGSPIYLSPEMLYTVTITQTSMDFYSLGTLLVEILSGAHPNQYYGAALGRQTESTYVLLLDEMQSGNVRAPTSGFSPDCLDFLGKMMSMNPNDRFDAKEFLQHPFVSKHASKKVNVGSDSGSGSGSGSGSNASVQKSPKPDTDRSPSRIPQIEKTSSSTSMSKNIMVGSLVTVGILLVVAGTFYVVALVR